MSEGFCYDWFFGAWYSKRNPYAKRRPKWRDLEERAIYPEDQNLTAEQSDLLRESGCPYCDLWGRCDLYTNKDGRYHLCLEDSEGHWSFLGGRMIWTKRVWVYVRREATALKLADYMDMIIARLEEDGEARSVRDLSRTTGVPLTTCQKIVNGLIDGGVLKKEERIINNRVHHVISIDEPKHTDFLFQSIRVRKEKRGIISTILFPEEG